MGKPDKGDEDIGNVVRATAVAIATVAVLWIGAAGEARAESGQPDDTARELQQLSRREALGYVT